MIINPEYSFRLFLDTYHFETRYFDKGGKITLFVTPVFVTPVDLEYRWFVGKLTIKNNFDHKTPTGIQKFLQRQLSDPLFEIEWLRKLYEKYPDAIC